jgi:hypothetical protein
VSANRQMPVGAMGMPLDADTQEVSAAAKAGRNQPARVDRVG